MLQNIIHSFDFIINWIVKLFDLRTNNTSYNTANSESKLNKVDTQVQQCSPLINA